MGSRLDIYNSLLFALEIEIIGLLWWLDKRDPPLMQETGVQSLIPEDSHVLHSN